MLGKRACKHQRQPRCIGRSKTGAAPNFSALTRKRMANGRPKLTKEAPKPQRIERMRPRVMEEPEASSGRAKTQLRGAGPLTAQMLTPMTTRTTPRDYAASSRVKSMLELKAAAAAAGFQRPRKSPERWKREKLYRCFNGKTEKDLARFPSPHRKLRRRQDRTRYQRRDNVNEVRNRDKGDGPGKKHQREDGPREPGVLPGPIASEFMGKVKLAFMTPATSKRTSPYGCIPTCEINTSCLPTLKRDTNLPAQLLSTWRADSHDFTSFLRPARPSEFFSCLPHEMDSPAFRNSAKKRHVRPRCFFHEPEHISNQA